MGLKNYEYVEGIWWRRWRWWRGR